jgi:ABC-type Fe3+ transport system permease subunit
MNQPPGHNPFEPPPVGSYGGPPGTSPAPPASSEAVASLVCGILAWSCFPMGIVALWLGARARRTARENPGRVGGDNLALGGMITGGIFLGLWLLYFVGLFVMIVVSVLKR